MATRELKCPACNGASAHIVECSLCANTGVYPDLTAPAPSSPSAPGEKFLEFANHLGDPGTSMLAVSASPSATVLKKTWYIEARVGSENHRGDCVHYIDDRRGSDGGYINRKAEDVLAEAFAQIAARDAELAAARGDGEAMRELMLRRIDETDATRAELERVRSADVFHILSAVGAVVALQAVHDQICSCPYYPLGCDIKEIYAEIEHQLEKRAEMERNRDVDRAELERVRAELDTYAMSDVVELTERLRLADESDVMLLAERDAAIADRDRTREEAAHWRDVSQQRWGELERLVGMRLEDNSPYDAARRVVAERDAARAEIANLGEQIGKLSVELKQAQADAAVKHEAFEVVGAMARTLISENRKPTQEEFNAVAEKINNAFRDTAGRALLAELESLRIKVRDLEGIDVAADETSAALFREIEDNDRLRAALGRAVAALREYATGAACWKCDHLLTGTTVKTCDKCDPLRAIIADPDSAAASETWQESNDEHTAAQALLKYVRFQPDDYDPRSGGYAVKNLSCQLRALHDAVAAVSARRGTGGR